MPLKYFMEMFSIAYPSVEIELIEDNARPFPIFELEISWEEWRWNDAGTDRLDETIVEGTTINPVDFLGEDGNLNGIELGKVTMRTLINIAANPERVGAITVKG